MAKYSHAIFTGASGKTSRFEVWDFYTHWNPVSANYVVTKQSTNQKGEVEYPVIYCGEAEDLQERFSNHHKAKCFKDEYATLL